MKAYWIVRLDGILVAVLAERFYTDARLIVELQEMAQTGPLERVVTDQPMVLGESFDL